MRDVPAHGVRPASLRKVRVCMRVVVRELELELERERERDKQRHALVGYEYWRANRGHDVPRAYVCGRRFSRAELTIRAGEVGQINSVKGFFSRPLGVRPRQTMWLLD